MKITSLFAAFLIATPALVAAAPAPAQSVVLTSNVMAEKTTVVAGREQVALVKPDSVVPGDKLLFQTSFKNGGARPADRFVVTNPVPTGVAFTGESSVGVELSVDGGKSYGALSALTVKTPTGPRAARATDVTHLRWTLATIAPGASGTLRYRGVVR